MQNSFNKNDRQHYFNQVRGIITEFNDGDSFCSLTLNVGHENTRFVNLVSKKNEFDKIKSKYNIGDKVTIRFYLTSKNKFGRWYTTPNILEVF